MVKKASPTGQAGSVGQDAVKLEFSKMGWGPIPVLEHDDGTDFYVQVWDATLGATRSSEAELHEVGRRGLSSLNGVTWGTTTGPSSTKERSRTLERQETR